MTANSRVTSSRRRAGKANMASLCSCTSDLQVEGLFRVPGNSVRQQTLRELLNSGADVDLESGDFHPNDVATLLKSFLGELPEPLLTHRHFHAHLKIAGTITDALLHSSELIKTWNVR